jgi:hypothetical protein
MANLKKNKNLMRCLVAGGTLLSCAGIWVSLVNQGQPVQSAVEAPAVAFVLPEISSTAIPGPSPSITIPPVITSKPTTIPQVTPVKPVTPIPTVTSRPTPTVTPVVPKPAPRLRTRGS